MAHWLCVYDMIMIEMNCETVNSAEIILRLKLCLSFLFVLLVMLIDNVADAGCRCCGW